MSKTQKIKSADLETAIMKRVRSNEITMKPRWYFIMGSVLMIIGLIGLSIGAIFLTNLTFFLLRQHGPMGQWRIQLMLNSFPWWIPVLAILGTVGGVWMLKKYDFSYKKNFWFIIIGFIISILCAAFLLDYLGLNTIWSRGPMRRFYQQIEKQDPTFQRGQGQGRGRMQNNPL